MKVQKLKETVFSSLSLPEKVDLKNNGRPVPVLNITQIQAACRARGSFTRKFDASVYDKCFWLCGCEDSNAFFCFVCLLYGGDDNWTKEGVNDLKHLHVKIKKHEKSTRHQHNTVSFQLLGRCNIAESLSSAYTEAVRTHNELVTKNREVLSKIIDVLKLCGACNLPLRGHDESASSHNKGVFLELIEYSKNLDPVLRNHFENAKVFKGTSKTIQNELLECMFQVCREFIIDEIRQSSFLACMVDDTTDVSTRTQTVIVFRYELKGTVHERFWGFFNAENHTAVGLSKCILQELQPLLQDHPEKLIAQTYDGAAVFRGHVRGVNVIVKNVYKSAHYIYCYAHQLNRLLEKVSSSVSSVKVFFVNLKGMSVFFSNSPERTSALDDVCSARIPRVCETRWNFRSRLIRTIFENKDSILLCFKNIQSEASKPHTAETVSQAAGFIKWLNDDTFLFWLHFFNNVMPHVDILYAQLQKIETDVAKIQQAVYCFETSLLNIRQRLPSSIQITQEEPLPKRRCGSSAQDLNTAAREICDYILAEVKDRFEFKNHLSGAKLFLLENYEDYKRRLPVDDVNRFCDAFPVIDRDDFMHELDVFYSRAEFSRNGNISGCLKTLDFLISFGLDTTVFKEITKALKILVTMPMTTCETERCFSTLKLIKSYLRNSMGEDRLTALGMLSIEKQMVKQIPNFNNKVIEKFINDTNKSRRMEFHYK